MSSTSVCHQRSLSARNFDVFKGPASVSSPGDCSWLVRPLVHSEIYCAVFREQPDFRTQKIVPDEQVEPSILESFLQSNRAARELIYRASDYDVNRIRFKNPFIPMLRFTAGTGLEIISKHQSRHLLQAERVRQSTDFPEQ